MAEIKIDQEVMESFVRKNFEIMRDKLLGRTKDYDYVLGFKPSDILFIGTLHTQSADEEKAKYRSMVSPYNLKAEFLISKNTPKDAKIKIIPSAFFYYRVFPKLQEQKDHNFSHLKTESFGGKEFEEIIKKSVEAKDEGKKPYLNYAQKLIEAYKRIKLPDTALTIAFKDILKKPADSFDLKEKIKEISDKADEDNDVFYKKQEVAEAEEAEELGEETEEKKKKVSFRAKEIAQKIPLYALESEDAFKEELALWNNQQVSPEWSLSINYELRDFDDKHYLLSIEFANDSRKKADQYHERTIFDAKLVIELDKTNLEPFVADYLKDDYKYNGRIYGKGENCNLEVSPDCKKITTKHIATFSQKKYLPNTHVKSNGEEIYAYFDKLSTDPILILNGILKAMKKELENSNKLFEKRKKEDKTFTAEGQERFKADIEKFENEIKRFEVGISIIDSKDIAKKAFKLMNKSFIGGKYKSWYIFQIIFIVMNIPDLVVSEYKDEAIPNNRDKVDIIHFPTGGGKTEAYLGLIVFTAFFDRLRGKKIGVSAWTKFPLRMLSLQQLERIAKVFAKAEIIRHKEDIGGEPFSMGYYVGKYNTPNKITDPYNNENFIDFVNKTDPEKYLVISKCPFCGSEVKLKGDADTLRILHICTNKECPNPNEEKILPVYITDNECYRYLPTFIISTLDKITIVNTNKSFKQFYGQIKYKCPKHGYFFVKDWCIERCSKNVDGIPTCTVDPSEYEEVGELKDLSPTLLIQDEMHLIREDFGTLDSHFETFLNYFQKLLENGKEMKIIAATATITNYERQLNQLYLKKGESFPFGGHERTKSFYAMEVDELHRLICGIVPHDRAPIWAHYSILELYYRLIRDYIKNPQKIIDLKIGIKELSEAKELIRIYRNLLSYHLSRREADTLKQSIETQVNEQLKLDGYKPIRKEDITGDKDFKQVRTMLNLLSSKDIPDEKRVDLIVATKMISHGVDLEDLNFMSFMGMPRNNSEYIQAMSRVGRTYPGIVFITFNANRERDKSYYKYFEKFHDYKDLLVEAVPLTRWSKYSIQKTLPGLFTATVLNYFNAVKDDEIYKKGIKKLIVNPAHFAKAAIQGNDADKVFTQAEVIDFLKKSLQTDKDPLKPNFDEEIEKSVPRFYGKIEKRAKTKMNFFPPALEKAPSPSYKILKSLRDIGEQCNIVMGRDALILERIKPDTNLYGDDKDEENDIDDGYKGEGEEVEKG